MIFVSGWIACGCTDGVLKIMKLEAESRKNGVVSGGNLSMNQALEGHQGNTYLRILYTFLSVRLRFSFADILSRHCLCCGMERKIFQTNFQ